MGSEDDENAVTNKYGKVHGIEGLRVVDCSIMPDCVRANTNATAIMMGEKISDHIKLGDWLIETDWFKKKSKEWW